VGLFLAFQLACQAAIAARADSSAVSIARVQQSWFASQIRSCICSKPYKKPALSRAAEQQEVTSVGIVSQIK